MPPGLRTPEQIDALLAPLRQALRERRLHLELERHPEEGPPTGLAYFADHEAAEAAVCRLSAAGVSLHQISVVGHGAAEAADQRLWNDGIFGLMRRARRFRTLPEMGGLIVLGPLAGLTDGDSGDGALVRGLVTTGIPRRRSLSIRRRIQTGMLLVLVHSRLHETLPMRHDDRRRETDHEPTRE